MKAKFEESDKCHKIPEVGDVWKYRNFSDIYIRIRDDQGYNALNKDFDIDLFLFSVNIETGVICASNKKYSAYNIIILKPKEPIVFIKETN